MDYHTVFDVCWEDFRGIFRGFLGRMFCLGGIFSMACGR